MPESKKPKKPEHRPTAMGSTTTHRTRRRVKVTDEVIADIRSLIVSGRLSQGTRLPSVSELSAHYQVSPASIREACRALESVGLVDVRHGSGIYVTADPQHILSQSLETISEIHDVGILDVMNLRIVLAKYSASLAAQRATLEDLERINALNQEIAEVIAAPDRHDSAASASLNFQLAVSAACHDSILHAFEGVLARTMIAIQESVFSRRGLDTLWLQIATESSSDRDHIIAALTSHSADDASTTVSEYLAHQSRVFTKDPELSSQNLFATGQRPLARHASLSDLLFDH